MSDLAEFLLARIAEDEAAARKVIEYQGNAGGSWTVGSIETFVGATWLAEHIARHDPARVLAECEAKRRIVEQLWLYVARPDPTSSDPSGTQAVWIVKTLAVPYADHPGYRDEWRCV